MNSNNNNHNDDNNSNSPNLQIRSNHAPLGNPIFLDDDDVKNDSIKASIIKLELKKRAMIEKYRETDYYKSQQDKTKSKKEDK